MALARALALLLALLPGCAVAPQRPRPAEPRWHSGAGGQREATALAGPVGEAGEGIPHAPGRYFSPEAFHEDALAGPHEHAVVRLGEISILVIRDEDVYRTPPDRAGLIARTLDEALHMGDRFFVLGTDGDLPAIYSVSHHGGYPRLLLRATRADAVAYARRSERDVDQRLLAEWWLALLKAVLRVVFLNEAPQIGAPAEVTASLSELRGQLWGGGRVEPVSPERLAAAEARLSAETLRRLQSLAFTMPRDFVGLPAGEATAYEIP